MSAPTMRGTRSQNDARPELASFVGRENALARLTALFETARGGRPRALLVSGGAGLGKSRLIEEFARTLPRDGAFHIRLQCAPMHRESPLWPFQRQLLRVTRIRSEDGPALRAEKLRQYLALPGAETDGAHSALSDLLDFGAATGLTGALRKRRVLDAIAASFASRAALRPLVVTIEDAHWIDDSSQEMLAHLLASADGWPMLLVLTCRPEGRAAVGTLPFDEELVLEPLEADVARRLAASVSTQDDLTEGQIAEIADRSGGNPLLLEELTRATALSADREVPGTLAEGLSSQLAGDGEARTLLFAAACIGTDFDTTLLARILGEGHASLMRALRPLEAAGLVFRRGPASETLYGFRHSLIAETARGWGSVATARAHHAAILDALSEDADALPELVAAHAEAAGRYDMAIERLEAAGKRASSRGAVAEAGRHIEDAIALLPKSDLPPSDRAARELSLQLALGATLISAKGYAADATRAAFQRAEMLGRQLGNPAQHIATLYGMYGYSLVGAEIEAAHRIAGEILGAAEAEGHARARIVGHRTRGLTCSYLGRFAEANDHLRAVLELYDGAGDGLVTELSNDPKVTAHCFLSVNRLAMGRPAEGRRHAQAAVAHAQTLGHLPSLCYALDFLCTSDEMTRAPARMRDNARLLMERADEQGLEYWGALGRIWLGWERATVAGEASGLAAMREGVTALEATGGALVTPYFLGLVGAVSSALGETEDATVAISEAILRARQTSERWYLAELYRLDALHGTGCADPAVAEARLRDALALSSEQGAALWGLRAATDLARLKLASGETGRSEARALLETALGTVRERSEMPDIVAAIDLLRSLSAQ